MAGNLGYMTEFSDILAGETAVNKSTHLLSDASTGVVIDISTVLHHLGVSEFERILVPDRVCVLAGILEFKGIENSFGSFLHRISGVISDILCCLSLSIVDAGRALLGLH